MQVQAEIAGLNSMGGLWPQHPSAHIKVWIIVKLGSKSCTGGMSLQSAHTKVLVIKVGYEKVQRGGGEHDENDIIWNVERSSLFPVLDLLPL